MHIPRSVRAPSVLLGLGVGAVCDSSGCGAGPPGTIASVVETPEQVQRREQGFRDAMKRGAYGRPDRGTALRGPSR